MDRVLRPLGIAFALLAGTLPAHAQNRPPWPAGDVVYVVSKSGEVICASRDNGQIYWIRDLNEGLKKPKRQGGVFGIGGAIRPPRPLSRAASRAPSSLAPCRRTRTSRAR